jgi:L-lactate dehydrogenase complex protein LldF
MRYWREEQFQRNLTPPTARYGLGVWAYAARRPQLYRLGARLAIRLLALVGRRRGRFGWLPLAGGWTGSRDLPAPAGRTFIDLWQTGGRGRAQAAQRAVAPGQGPKR